MKRRDITIYYPLCCNGIYEPMAYSFNGTLTAFSSNREAFKFMKKSFLTEKECQKECDRLNNKG